VRRREFITLLGGAAAAWSVAARAQQPAPPSIGLVSIGADPIDPVVFRPFFEQMQQLGYFEGKNIAFERRFARGRDELIDDFVAELVRRPVDILVVTGARESIAAKRATPSIPIVMVVNPDPVRTGLVASLARPGGNVTGLTTMDWDIYGKRIELLKQCLPGLSKVALLISRGNPTYNHKSEWARDVAMVARSLSIETEIVEAGPDEFEGAISAMAARGIQALLGAIDGVIFSHRWEIADLAINYRLPTVFGIRQHAQAGAFIVYAPRVDELSRRAAFFVDRILKGANVADLPIEQPTIFEMIINLKTAKALGVDVPTNLLALADEVIE
jgi:putative tryptophan/tyrosine transport system substrate-binding protein